MENIFEQQVAVIGIEVADIEWIEYFNQAMDALQYQMEREMISWHEFQERKEALESKFNNWRQQ